jgi:F-type H+-transporting ATPase subunit delta
MTSHVGRNYARALFDLALETGSPDTVEEDLRAARTALHSDRDAREFLANRLISRVTKKKLVRAAFEGKADARLVVLLFLLVDRGRTRLLGEIEEEFARLARMARGVRGVKLASAFALEPAQTASLTRSLETRFSARVELESGVDKGLIGGLVAVSEGQEIEYSIRGQLAELASMLRAAPGEEERTSAHQPG